MAKLEIDLSNPNPHVPIAWSKGTAVNLAAIYPNQPAAGSVHFASSPDSIDREIHFDNGLVVQQSRNPSARAGEVFGFFFDIRGIQHSQRIRIDVEYDIHEALERSSPSDLPFWLNFITRLIRVPI